MKYSAYGACIDSDFALTGLPEASSKEAPSIRLAFTAGRLGDITGEATYSENVFQGRRVLAYQGKEYGFVVEGIGFFRISPGTGVISFRPSPGVSDQPLRYWLLRYMVPFHLAVESHVALFHGSAVKVGSGAVGFLANSFGGKSTLANYLHQKGHFLITDDDLRVDGDGPFMAVPSIPFVRPYRRQEDLGHRVERFSQRPEPLRKIYILELSDAPASIIPLSAVEAATVLLQQNRFRLIQGMAERFRFCARLASTVPMARLVIPRAISRLPEVYEALLADLEECSWTVTMS